jgi:hypothetical protein
LRASCAPIRTLWDNACFVRIGKLTTVFDHRYGGIF